MEDLPIEILSQILTYLKLTDRREFALTCRKFYEASLDPDLHWNSTYFFDAQSLLPEDGQPANGEERCFYCRSPNLHISGLEENINARSLISPHNGCVSILGPHIRRLSLKGSSILEGSFIEILKCCESLESLNITGCNSLFMTGSFLSQPERYGVVEKVLKSTTGLNLSSIRYMNDSCLKTLIILSPSLTSIALASCNILFSEFGSTQHLALTFPCFLQMVLLRSSTLIRIDLSRTGLTNSAVKELSCVKNLRLEEIIFQNCRELGDSGVIALANHQRCLHVVDLRGCSEIGNPAISAICTCLSNLKELYISKCRKVNDVSATKISFLENLEVLDISECYDVTTKSIPSILRLPSITHFVANGCNFGEFHQRMIQDHFITGEQTSSLRKSHLISQPACFARLTKLSINSGTCVTDLTIQSIFVHLDNLEYLSLSWCHFVTDRGLLGLDVSIPKEWTFPNVEKIEAHFGSIAKYSTNHGRTGFLQSPVSEEFFNHVDWSDVDVRSCLKERGIARLRRLRHLSISNCPKVTDESFIRIFCVGQPLFPNMECLELNMMQRSVTDDVLNGISIGCPLLTRLSVSCSNVTDEGIGAVTRRLHRLEMLNLSNCANVTPKFFQSLIRNSRWIRELDISSCKQIPASSAEQLCKSLPLLTRIHTRYSGGRNHH